MPRPPRIEFPGAWYHAMNRAAGRRSIFRSDAQRRAFLDLLGEASATYGIEVHAYCLMGKHYHLLLHTPRGNLSTAMRHINGVYTQRINRALATNGPLFRGRYKAVLIDADRYLAQVSRYIHLKPVAARLTGRAERYRWSSYQSYLGQRDPLPWLQTAAILALFGRSRAQDRYRAFVAQGMDEELEAFYGKKNLSSVLGDMPYLRRVKRRQRAKAPATALPRALRAADIPSLKTIINVTAAHFNVDLKTLRRAIRGRSQTNTPRAIAMTLARESAGYPLAAIAELLGAGDLSTVSVTVRRLRARLAEEPALAKQVDKIRRKLFAR